MKSQPKTTVQQFEQACRRVEALARTLVAEGHIVQLAIGLRTVPSHRQCQTPVLVEQVLLPSKEAPLVPTGARMRADVRESVFPALAQEREP